MLKTYLLCENYHSISCLKIHRYTYKKQTTRNNKDYLNYGHNLELYNSKPSVAGCSFYSKLPNNIKQIDHNNQFARELKKLLNTRLFERRILNYWQLIQADEYNV
jgi:hypothetical protein